MNYIFDNYGWYTGPSASVVPRSTPVAPTNQSLTTTDGQLRSNFTGYVWLDLPYVTPAPIPTPVPIVPQVVTMRQARLALDAAGLLSSVQAAINAGSNAAKITWEYSSEVQRNNGLIPTMAAALGMTETQIDNLFIAAAVL